MPRCSVNTVVAVWRDTEVFTWKGMDKFQLMNGLNHL